jgi:hypothetical protein
MLLDQENPRRFREQLSPACTHACAFRVEREKLKKEHFTVSACFT